MKDIDFDELDRAVASVLGSGSQSFDEPAATDPPRPVEQPQPQAEAVVDQKDTSTSISSHAVHARIMPSATAGRATLQRPTPLVAPEKNDTEQEQSTPPPSTPAPQYSPATKRTIPHREGKFMDVLRPGQQTKSATTAGTTLSPTLSAPVQPKRLEEHSVSEISTPQPTNVHLEAAINELLESEGHDTHAEQVDISDATSQEESLPKPMDLSAQQDVTPPEQLPENNQPHTDAPADIDAIAAALTKPVGEQTSEPSGSPFLSDAKVQKRPLGSAEQPLSGAPAISQAGATNLDTTVARPAASIADIPQNDEAPVPAELQKGLLQIESGTAQESPAPSTGDEKSSGPTSIARQYKEQLRSSSDDDETGAIFDPQSYQHPIEHPAKKSSGWGWVIAIVLIILAAIAAAVAAWMAGVLPVAL